MDSAVCRAAPDKAGVSEYAKYDTDLPSGFAGGAIVIAKYGRFPHWPAQVVNNETMGKVKVCFLGSGDFATLPSKGVLTFNMANAAK